MGFDYRVLGEAAVMILFLLGLCVIAAAFSHWSGKKKEAGFKRTIDEVISSLDVIVKDKRYMGSASRIVREQSREVVPGRETEVELLCKTTLGSWYFVTFKMRHSNLVTKSIKVRAAGDKEAKQGLSDTPELYESEFGEVDLA